jgi:pyridoxal phosphate enzyme (YggS family)
MQDIAANLARIQERIDKAAARAGRSSRDVKLIAVSKTHDADAVAAALRAGQRRFGENTTQEALQKIPQFEGQEAEWHFIGHVQSNKARFIPGNFHWLHSLEDAKLADRLARFWQPHQPIVNVLIEVNITGDPAKHGVDANGLFPLLDQLTIQKRPGLELRGLMTIGPHAADETSTRAAFSALRNLRDQCIQRYALPHFDELSMGMSGDFEIAIEEGATLVRIGTAIFGERDYEK